MGRHAARVPVVAGSLGMAKDQHQPASSRAIATLAMTGFFLRVVNVCHRWCSVDCRRVRGTRGGRGGVPPGSQPSPGGAVGPDGDARRPRPVVAGRDCCRSCDRGL